MKRKLCLSLFALSLTGLLSAQKLPGTADSTFNGNGYALFNYGDKSAQGITGLIGPDGKLITFGGSLTPNSKWDVGISRINLDGTDDMTFRSNSGPSHLDFNNGGNDWISAVARHPDGGTVAVGGITGLNGSDVFVVKFNADGAVDLNFGTNGIFTYEVDPGYEVVEHVLVDKNNRTVLLGNMPNTQKKMFIMRLTESGAVDSTFSSAGILITDPLNLSNTPVAILERPQGGYYMVCNTNGNSASRVTVQSISDNGNLNIDLGGPGEVSLKLGPFDVQAERAIFHNGSIFICGNFDGPQGNQDGFLARFETDGTWNPNFGSLGYVPIVHNLSNPYEEEVHAMAIAPDSSIFLATICQTPDTMTLILSRFQSDGNVNGFYGNKNGSHHSFAIVDTVSEFGIDNIVLDTGAKRLYIMGQQFTPGKNGYYVYATHTGDFKQATNGGGTGIQRNNKSLNVFPNPASTWMKLDLNEDQAVSVRLYDLQGREVMHSNSTNLNIQHLNTGIYFVRAMQDGQTYSAKIQILN